MKFLTKVVKWIFGVVLLGLIVSSFHFLLRLSKSFVKTLWITLKYGFIVGMWLLYFITRVATWPFRMCFPPKSIDSMSGIDFERFIAKWLALEGYRSIRTTSATADYGVDILAIREDTPIGVQCKRYSGKVGVSAIQEITAGLSIYDCRKGIVVTNSVFTQNAIDLALSNGIELIDGEDLRASRAAKTLVRSYFSMFMSSLLMAVITLLVAFANIWLYRFARSFFPLSLMLLAICLLALANGICELKDRKRKDEEWDEDEEEDYDEEDFREEEIDDLTAPF